MAKLKGLGRGLDSLLSSSSDDLDNPVKLIELNKLFSGKTQPRKSFNDQSLESLSESIRSSGIMQPIVVRKTEFDDKYEIIAGERRWRAAGIANLKKVPVIVRKVDDKKSLVLSLIENIQREDLNAVEEAEAINKLITNYNLSHQQASTSLGKSRSAITNALRLLTLDKKIHDYIVNKSLEMGHARALIGFDKDKQIKLAKKIIAENLSVREVESIVKGRVSKSKNTKKILKDPNIGALEEKLSSKLGMQVKISHNQKNQKGRLEIKYHGLDELDHLITKF
ncbi:MAG: ParB/RepB/Spo0J family partition protein [Hydrogenophilales bacterium]|jgi:ParB family chromosome partitioning protein